MKKIGIVITRVGGSTERLFSCNTDGWENRISSERERLEHLVLPDERIPVFYMLSFNDAGCYFRVMRVLSNKSKSYISINIFIPCGVKIDGKDMSNLTDAATELIETIDENTQEVSADQLAVFCQNEYKPEGPNYPRPRSKEMAYRFYGKGSGEFTLRDLLSQLYQACYSDYDSVFIIDKGAGIAIRAESKAANLTESILTQAIILKKIVTTGRTLPTKVYVNDTFYDGNPMYVGGMIDIKFEHSDFATIICKQCRVPDTGILALQLNWKKKYTSEVIRVVDSTSKTIEGCEISVGGRYLPVYLSEDEARNVEVCVQKKGYVSVKMTKDLWSYPSVLITLEKEQCAQEFYIDSVTDPSLAGKVKFEVDVADIPDKSPIEGYRFTKNRGDKIHLSYDEFGFIRNIKGIGIAVGGILISMIIGAFIGYAIASSSFEAKLNPEWKDRQEEAKEKEKKERAEESHITPVVDSAKIVRDSLALIQKQKQEAAKAYLTSHEKWTPAASKNELLEGLFKAINTYDLEKLRSIAEQVPGYDWEPLLQAVEKGGAKAKAKTGRSTYNAKANDTVITIAGYIDYLNKVE
ncbi:MAG: hypothetical protein MJY67_01900 [Bacteroidales bacterium]|nr:hypothetical protein [Bacteroidales bacterium]